MDHRTHTINRYAEAFDTLCDRNLKQSMYNECDVLLQDVLLVLHGMDHTRRRSTELKLFRRDFIRYYLREVYPATLRQTLQPYLEQGRMDLLEFARRVNINLSADFAGIDRPRQSPEESEQLANLVRKFGEGATLFHSTRDKDEVRAEVAAAIDEFDRDFYRISKQRRVDALQAVEAGHLSADELPRDILTVLLQNQTSLEMDNDAIRREIAFFLQAGSHSSGNAMVHAFHDITVWRSAHAEDDARLRSDPLFVQRCVHESMRLHPASPTAWRSPVCPMSLASGEQIDTNDSVMVDMQRANQDTKVFGDDAHSFNPHRQIEGRYPPYGLTFGIGVHTCFGRDLAGGEVGNPDSNPDEHHFGIVTSLIQNLLDAGAVPDPQDLPRQDENTQRQNWAYYPVIFAHAVNE